MLCSVWNCWRLQDSLAFVLQGLMRSCLWLLCEHELMVSPGRCQSRVPHNGPARNFISPTSSNVQQSLAGLRDFCETVCYVLLSMTKTNLLDDIVVEDVLSDVDDISVVILEFLDCSS